MKFKPTADVRHLHPYFWEKVFPLVERFWPVVYPEDADGPLVTSGHETTSKHGDDSKHYLKNCKSGYCEAADFRMNDVPNARAHHFAHGLETYLLILHNVRTKIFLEGELTPNAHFHVQLIL